uniref:Uncharacterized protein n=1 Tax=Oryza sativa subsp. japonica TaxID=39947 RepID=Q2QQM9_ORYSJ|nr:hypothetical protein LOC_Os12g30480 [Oryza sativa Japonica Group]
MEPSSCMSSNCQSQLDVGEVKLHLYLIDSLAQDWTSVCISPMLNKHYLRLLVADRYAPRLLVETIDHRDGERNFLVDVNSTSMVDH